MNEEMRVTDFMPEEEAGEQTQGFTIKDDLAADWALDKIREARADKQRMKIVIDQKISQMEIALAKKTKESNDTEAFFTGALREYFKTLKTKNTKTQKKYELPSGKLIEKIKDWDYKQDKELLLDWAEDADPENLVKTVREPKWAEIKKAGEVTIGIIANITTGKIYGPEVVWHKDLGAIDQESGELVNDAEYIDKAVLVYKGQVIKGVTLSEPQPEFKVEV